MNDIFFLIPSVVLIVLLSVCVALHIKKQMAIEAVKGLSPAEKNDILNRMAEPVGYAYEPCQDIFMSRQDAPQKLFGYTSVYDLSAPYFNMVFDYETIYFDYDDRTWLVEMWKGQYGILSGCELGIYYADRIVPPEKYAVTLFKAVESNDMLPIALKLNRHPSRRDLQYARLGQMRSRHWWLTIFSMGTFSKPSQLFVNTSIRFKNREMLHCFMERFREAFPDTAYKVNGLTVYFTFSKSGREYSAYKRLVRRTALTFCHMFCNWFHHLTRPFANSCDKLLFIYYYLPFAIRILFRHIPGR